MAPRFQRTTVGLLLMFLVIGSEARRRWVETMSIVANYLTPFKYIAKDIRYKQNKDLMRREFYKQFPKPPLKRLHSELVGQCDRGMESCAREIKEKALQSWSLQSTSFAKSGKTKALSAMADRFHPFKTPLEEFQYKTSALYYMCYYSLMDHPYMISINNGRNCLATIKDSNDVLDFANEEDNFKIEDSRSDQVPYQCAQIYFCPETCYALDNHGLMNSDYVRRKDIYNPCFDLKRDDSCSWIEEGNEDMTALMKNNFNYTCNCEKNFKKGFKWSNELKICVDIDECYEGVGRCADDQLCQNTKGGYICHCKRGFQLNEESKQCEEHIALPKAKLISKRKKPKPAGMSFGKQLQIWIGLEDAGVQSVPSVYLCTISFILTCVIIS